MLQCYGLRMMRHFSDSDLTVEVYGCDLRCRACCSAFGRRRPPRYRGVEDVFERASAVARRAHPQLVRYTGGEFSLFGHESMQLYSRLDRALGVRQVIETHAKNARFYRGFSRLLAGERRSTPPAFIVSIKHSQHVLSGRYNTGEVVRNVREMHGLFPESHFAHGFIGFGGGFRAALFKYFPELEAHSPEIYLEQERRFRFEALSVADGERRLYYFDQKVKRYAVGRAREKTSC